MVEHEHLHDRQTTTATASAPADSALRERADNSALQRPRRTLVVELARATSSASTQERFELPVKHLVSRFELIAGWDHLAAAEALEGGVAVAVGALSVAQMTARTVTTGSGVEATCMVGSTLDPNSSVPPVRARDERQPSGHDRTEVGPDQAITLGPVQTIIPTQTARRDRARHARSDGCFQTPAGRRGQATPAGTSSGETSADPPLPPGQIIPASRSVRPSLAQTLSEPG